MTDATPERIFIIEDDPDILELLAHALSTRGYAVESALDGQEGLARLQAADPPPDLVLLDLLLPGLHGLEVCRRLTAEFGPDGPPVIIISAKGEEADVVAGLEAGAVDYVTKPFGTRELCGRLARQLRLHRDRRLLRTRLFRANGEGGNHRTEADKDRLVHTDRLVSLGTMVAAINHEICNANTNIGGYAALLRRNADRLAMSDPDAADGIRRSIESIEHGSRRIERIVDMVLDYARPPRRSSASADLRSVLESAIELTAGRTRPAIRTLENAVPEGLTAAVPPAELQQVFVNLLTNAADAIAERRRDDRSVDGRVRVAAGRRGERLWLDFTDNGVGMSEAIRARVFEPFFTTKGNGCGTGLGLGIAQQLVERAGGTMVCRTAPQDGATFRIELPAASPPAEASRTDDAPSGDCIAARSS